MAVAGAAAMIAPEAAARQDALGQERPPSLGELARRLRAEKRPVNQSAKVWTNENIPANPFAISVFGPPPPPPEPVPSVDAATTPKKDKTLTDLEAELAQAQEQLATLEKETDLAKRDYALQQQAFYNNPLSSQDTDGQAKLVDAQAQIDSKAQDVEKAKAHVAELQQKVDEMKKASPAPGPDTNNPGN